MKATLVVTGGFTGIPGKWEVDPTSAEMKSMVTPGEWQVFENLVAQAQAERVFDEDYATKATTTVGPSTVSADMQYYELFIDGKSVKWSEPSTSDPGAVPDVVKALKRWITRNAKRNPFRPK